jgi:hypothetical protein
LPAPELEEPEPGETAGAGAGSGAGGGGLLSIPNSAWLCWAGVSLGAEAGGG